MTWRKRSKPKTSHPLLPQWFTAAKLENLSESEIYEKIKEECRSVLQWQCSQNGTEYRGEEPDDGWIRSILFMYETQYNLAQQ